MLKFFGKFFDDKLVNKGEYKNKIETDPNELKEILENIFSKIDWILLIEKKHWSERNICECSDDNFEILKKEINENWLSIDFTAGEFVVSKNVKNNKWSVSMILKSFIHETK